VKSWMTRLAHPATRIALRAKHGSPPPPSYHIVMAPDVYMSERNSYEVRGTSLSVFCRKRPRAGQRAPRASKPTSCASRCLAFHRVPVCARAGDFFQTYEVAPLASGGGRAVAARLAPPVSAEEADLLHDAVIAEANAASGAPDAAMAAAGASFGGHGSFDGYGGGAAAAASWESPDVGRAQTLLARLNATQAQAARSTQQARSDAAAASARVRSRARAVARLFCVRAFVCMSARLFL
jgi:hypothetical protein